MGKIFSPSFRHQTPRGKLIVFFVRRFALLNLGRRLRSGPFGVVVG